MRKIAPTLTAWVGLNTSPLAESHMKIRAELRAVLSVVRAAKRVRPYTEGWADRCDPVWDALDRLDKVSRP